MLLANKKLPKTYPSNSNLTFTSSEKEKILLKIDSNKNFEFDSKKEVIQGIIGGPDKAFIVKEDELNQFSKIEKDYLKMLHTNTGMYFTENSDKYIFYISKKNFKDNTLAQYPNIEKHFEPYKDELEEKKIKYKTPNKPYFHLHRERDETFFQEGAKLVFTSRTKGKTFSYTEEAFYGTRNLFFIKSDKVNLKYITALLNSTLMYFYMSKCLKHTGDLLQIDKNQFMKIPLFVPSDISDICNLTDSIINDKKTIIKYLKYIDSLNAIEKIEIREKIEQIERGIEANIQTIDILIYKLYNLTEDEIKLTEEELAANQT